MSGVLASVAMAFDDDENTYELWSDLIPILQKNEAQCGQGYLIAAQTVVPSGLPVAIRESNETPLERAMRMSKGPPAAFDTYAPAEFSASFAEALADAVARQKDPVEIEQKLRLPMPYRLLSTQEIKEWRDLSPAVAIPGWRQDKRARKHYKGWNELCSLSTPFWDATKGFAMVWAKTDSGSCSSAGWSFFKHETKGWVRLNWQSTVWNECA